ncbi:MAG: T9SS type A sorting domain-containing protein [Candidatus Zixiibacteriota bacterium]
MIKKFLKYSLVISLMACCNIMAQTTIAGNLTTHMDSIISEIPGSTPEGLYLQPGTSSRDLWRTIIQNILAENYDLADNDAGLINYRVVEFLDITESPNHTYYILERTPESTSRYWGTFIFNPSPKIYRLVIQSPHPKYDRNTGYQGFRIFKESGCRAFFVSGAHRCNGTTSSSCDGTTTACSSESEPYRYSDQAHVVLGTFQITTEEMISAISDLTFLQPHGFSKETGDPDIIISNGTKYHSDEDFIPDLVDNLLLQDNSLTFKIGHLDAEWTRLLATTNVQGRLVNGSLAPCGTDADTATGHFIHIEQAYTKLRDSETNWNKLVQAVIATFGDGSLDVADDASNDFRPTIFTLSPNYPNPFNGTTQIQYNLFQKSNIEIAVYDILGRRIEYEFRPHQSPGTYVYQFSSDNYASGVYLYRMIANSVGQTGKMVIIK